MLTPNLDRLQRLRTLMQNTPGERVDLITWTYEDPKCGTIACAVGWATQAPEFQKEGLMLSDGAPYYRGQYDWDAVTSFFGITEGQAEYLFLERRPQPKSYYRDDTKQLGETIPADDHELDDQSDRALILHRLDTFIRNAS